MAERTIPRSGAGEGGRRLTRASLGLAVATVAALPVGFIALCLLLLPLLVALALLHVPVLAIFVPVAIAFGLWAALAPVMLWEPFADVLARGVLGMRLPTPVERERLSARWGVVCARSGMPPTRFHLRIDPWRGVNAAAAARTVVGVTPDALALPTEELDVILAHEAGHHAHLHAVWGTLALWWLAPLAAIERIAGAVLALAALLLFPLNVLLTAIVWLVLAPLRVLLAPFLLIRSIASRAAEYEADAFAVRHADGKAALRLFATFADAEAPRSPGLVAAALATHPPSVDRCARIDELLARGRARTHLSTYAP